MTGLGWSGRCSGWDGGSVEQRHPLVFADARLRAGASEVAAAAAGGPSGNVDQVTADGGTASLGVAETGEGTGGAQHVAADRGERQRGGVGGEGPRRQEPEGVVGPVGGHLLGLGVAAMVFFGLQSCSTQNPLENTHFAAPGST